MRLAAKLEEHKADGSVCYKLLPVKYKNYDSHFTVSIDNQEETFLLLPETINALKTGKNVYYSVSMSSTKRYLVIRQRP